MISSSTGSKHSYAGEPTSQIADPIIDRNVMIPMRDGVRLAADIYRPARHGRAVGGRFPVILERTPYGKANISRGEIDHGASQPMSRLEVAQYFVEQGYIVIYQDCRGRYDSEGRFVKYLAEGEDGADTIAWIVAQPWSNRRVGTMGLSYAAHTQVALGCLAPAGLCAMVVDCGGFSSGYHSGMRQGGAFELRQATWAFNHAKQSPAAQADPTILAALEAEDLAAWFAVMPWKPGHSPLKWVPEYEAYLFEQWTRGTFDDYWRQLGIYAAGWYERLAEVPQIHLSGWYDTYVRTAVENYVGVRRQNKGSIKLIIGPWLHGDRSTAHAGDVDFGPMAPIDGNLAEHWRALRREWFDQWLKDDGKARTSGSGTDILLFVMGGGPGTRNDDGRLQHGGRWIGASAWPVPSTREMTLHFHENGTISLANPAKENVSVSYDFDPSHPVPTIGGSFSSGQPIFLAGAYDQREDVRFFGCAQNGLPLSHRSDVLVFETEPLKVDIAIVGTVGVELWVSSNCPDTDFTAKLIDYYPPSTDYPRGFAMNLTDGILRCRYRNGWERPELMKSGEAYRIMIELMPTANLFKVGHRIRLDISSSNFPKFDVNPNSGEPEGSASLKRIATNSVHLGAEYLSRLILPVIDAADIQSAALSASDRLGVQKPRPPI